MSQQKIKKLEEDIRQAEADYQAFLRQQEADRAAKEAEWTETTAHLTEERNALALEIKLKEYPKALVKSHKLCKICGAEMRPFKVARGGQEIKLWACQAGNLSEAHDLVTVE